MSYKPEVMVAGETKWCGNALRFATEKEAQDYVFDLAMRWTAVGDTRVVEAYLGHGAANRMAGAAHA